MGKEHVLGTGEAPRGARSAEGPEGPTHGTEPEGAEGPRGRGAEEPRSRGAEEPRSRGAEEAERRGEVERGPGAAGPCGTARATARAVTVEFHLEGNRPGRGIPRTGGTFQ